MNDTNLKHLWEYDHPYYCPTAHKEAHREHDSWNEFYDEFSDADLDYNLLVRWDWKPPSEENELDHHQLELCFVLQRKALLMTQFIRVQPEDEPRVIEWLRPRWERLQWMWQPISGDE